MTTILTKKNDTTGAPAPGDLTNSAGGAELAVNTFDKRLYTKDSGGNVVEIGTNPTILNIDNIEINGNTISSTNTNGPINLTPNGTGAVVVSKLQVTGTFQLDGNVTVGDSSADTLTVNSTITSNLIFTDNTYDIGASGATRPRTGYFGTSVVTPTASLSGNLTFTGTGNRITGDFSNATLVNRVMFQTSIANSATSINAIPNGTSTASNLRAVNNSDPTNSAFVGMAMASTEAQIVSGIYGTGTYAPMVLYTGGSERLRIDTAGKVLIGTNSAISGDARLQLVPSSDYAPALIIGSNSSAANWARLDFKNTNVASSAIIYQTQAGLFSIRTDGAFPITFETNGANERMRITSAGSIGIGTDSPSQRLHVSAGTILASNTSTNSATVAIAGNGSTVGTSAFELIQGGSSEAYVYNRANSFLVLGTNNTERMRILSSGNVGIGLTAPSERLEISGNYKQSNGTQGIQIVNTTVPYIQAFTTGGNNPLQINGQDLRFFTGASFGAESEKMRITSAGNVGIGTSSQGARLDVINTPTDTNDGRAILLIGDSSALAAGIGADIIFGSTYLSGGGVASGAFVGSRRENATSGNLANSLVFGTRGSVNNTVERMRITSAGNVGIGTTRPLAPLHIRVAAGASNDRGFIIQDATVGNGGEAWLSFKVQESADDERIKGAIVYANAGSDYGRGNLLFCLNNGNDNNNATISDERMRITSGGSLCLNNTTSPGGQPLFSKAFAGVGSAGLQVSANGSGAIDFYNASGGYVASTTVNASSVSYNTTSDYRLKENIAPMTGALEKVAQLKPVTYTWKVNGSAGQGFIAHELQEVIPDAVTGEKDAVNQDGTIKPQGVDTSYLVATLTAAIQEQQAIIESLTARIETLEKN